MSHVLNVSQTQALKTIYALSQDNQLAAKDGTVVTQIGAKAAGTTQKVLQDTANRAQHPKTFTTSVTLANQRQLAYFVRTNTGYTVVTQPQAGLWATDGLAMTLWSLGYFVIVGALIVRYATRRRRFGEVLGQLTMNLQRTRQHAAPEPVIVNPNEPLGPLAEEVNLLNTEMGHLRQKVALRQVSFDRLINHLPLGVMLIDTDREVVLSNEAMGSMLGHPIEAHRHPYVDDVKTYALARMIEHTFRNEKTHHQELELMMSQKAVDASVVSLNPGTDQFQALVILYDVTYLRRIEQMQMDFVGNVSHELKTPVTSITGFAETLLNGAKDNPETLTQFLQIIYDESRRLTQLITDILALSRSESGTTHVRSFNVLELVNQTLGSLDQTVQAKKLQVTVTVDPNLTLKSDSVKVSQIVRNLLNNAVFYNRDGGQVTVHAEMLAGQFRLSVQDTGIGIETDEQQRIFERFYRVDKARSRNNGGTGLGLAIVAELVRSLDGSVSVSSQLGVGTTFTVTLPLSD
ncbi:two component sensor transduction histidine kinase [Lacticaseibacillus brantae DSM 23927]|uniref:histidine kinase n=2 Tax=Lacticaseibacillus brantae TaxID=943673 RepID=A0A0R2AYA2_9LACO|nr:two component sensor transduction histidine kinase [Lacticaseibacillus brantae DSM 23927]